METILTETTEDEIITVYTSLAEKALEYQTNFGVFREEMYTQMSQSENEINWYQNRELAKMYEKLNK